MFRTDGKTVHVGAEKIITLYKVQVYVEKLENFNFTLNYTGDYAAAEKGQKIFIFILIMKIILSVQYGAVIEY
jgi:hypothetical protein